MYKNGFQGKKHSEESKLKMREARLGKSHPSHPAWNKGRPWPEETKAKMRTAALRLGIKPPKGYGFKSGPEHPNYKGGPGRKRHYRDRFQLLIKFNFTCQYCGRKAPEVILVIDHVIPLSKGGKDITKNKTVACEDCNKGKGNLFL